MYAYINTHRGTRENGLRHISPQLLNELITWACLSQFDDVADFGRRKIRDLIFRITLSPFVYQRVKKRHWQEFESFDGITN